MPPPPSSSPSKPSYAIIGGGIAGLALAISLHDRNVRVTIYEQASSLGEIGAGVSFTANALRAMKICHMGIYEAHERICTRNLWPSKQKTWFDYYDGQHETEAERLNAPAFTIGNENGQAGVHRARFLDEMKKLFPPEMVHFGKHLEGYERREGEEEGRKKGGYVLRFSDGTTAEADAVIGCDGIKSRVRRLMFGEEHPCARPAFTFKYAYRALAPMEKVIAAIGEEKAQNSCMHMGKGGHVLTFPINHGTTVNVVAFTSTTKDWTDQSKLTAPATREDALRDFGTFGHSVTKILELAEPKLDIWAIFHLGKNPPPSFHKEGVCLVGDAAHATSPHHGAGAGFCIEDSAVLATLLADERVVGSREIDVAFDIYNSLRRERGEQLVQSSAHQGNLYEWMVPGIEDDFAKIEAEITRRNSLIYDFDVGEMCTAALDDLTKRLSAA